ncbi:hypothetical protein WA026_013735 [Henosepilachna vigintioctopunctata]|uniref:Uncharacterized protein n=1 Tax=Henosepilachna vigintioctopunctata TaxID=420089 RepID=A0AAW1UZD7_9CUCU
MIEVSKMHISSSVVDMLQLDKLERLQNEAIKLLFQRNKRTPTKSSYKVLKLINIRKLIFRQHILFLPIATKIEKKNVTHTAANLFDELPNDVKERRNITYFISRVKQYLINKHLV